MPKEGPRLGNHQSCLFSTKNRHAGSEP